MHGRSVKKNNSNNFPLKLPTVLYWCQNILWTLACDY